MISSSWSTPRGPIEVVGGEQEQGDDLDPGLLAPVQELDDLGRADAVTVADRQPRLPRPPAVAVEDDPDVTRRRARRATTAQPPLVERVGDLAQIVPECHGGPR